MVAAGLALSLIAVCVKPASAAEPRETPGYPERVQEHDPREVARLPRYCIYTQLFRDTVPGGSDAAEIERWKRVFGPTYLALHHYCWGLMKTNRAFFHTQKAEVRNFYLESAVGEFDYVLRHATPDFVLLPEILTKKGEHLIRLGKAPAGTTELLRAIEAKPDYWPPYVVLSDHYRNTGDLTTARELLERALSFSPDAKVLKTRLRELAQVKSKDKASHQ